MPTAPCFPGTPAICDGSEAIASVETRISEGACSYPITPSTTMPAVYQAAVADASARPIVSDELTTSLPDLYAGGDLVRGAATVVAALADGMPRRRRDRRKAGIAADSRRVTSARSSVTRRARRSRGIDGNALRAAVLGANDGLVSNFSLVMGVAAASAGAEPVVIAGVAGLLAGSLSMALGEWLSVQSSRELYANRIGMISTELDHFPEAVAARLAAGYEARGLTGEQARDLADRMLGGDRTVALDMLARDELGVDPDELGGSAWTAALTSFVLFGIGAAVPLVPFLVGSGSRAIVLSALLSGAALFGLGAAITRMTGRHPVWAGLRQLGFGMAAAAITYGIGTLLGTAID